MGRNRRNTDASRQRHEAMRGRVIEGNGFRKGYKPTPYDRLQTALQSGPVKTWANMTPEEREKVLESLKGRK